MIRSLIQIAPNLVSAAPWEAPIATPEVALPDVLDLTSKKAVTELLQGGERPAAVDVATKKAGPQGPQPGQVTATSPKPANESVTKPLGAAARAEGQRAIEQLAVAPDPTHPYAATQEQARTELRALGITGETSNRIHVSDVEYGHGGEVMRTAAGKTSLISGADLSINAFDASIADVRRFASPEQAARVEALRKQAPGKTIDGIAATAANRLEASVVERTARLGVINDEAARLNDGKKTFVNMSYGLNAENASQGMAVQIATAKPGTEAYERATKLLGHPPRTDTNPFQGVRVHPEDLSKIQQEIAIPALNKQLEKPEFQARLSAAKSGLEAQVARGREHGVMVFAAAGNEGDSAARHSTVDNSVSTADSVRGIVSVGAVDIGRAERGDERVADFSSDGKISLSAPGVRIPVGMGFGDKGPFAADVSGTSYASPHAMQVAALMSSANPKLTVDQIERLMTDPRVVQDLPGTTRDGAGLIDPVNAALVARNPNITAAEIARLRASVQK
ncbi:MAG: S8 family serine peptidase [Myxococcota bacterium]